jgi:hypothetical protein
LHGRADESVCVGSVGRALLVDEDGVALADRHVGACESLDCLFDRGPLQPGVVQAAGELGERVRTQGLQQRFPLRVVAIQRGAADVAAASRIAAAVRSNRAAVFTSDVAGIADSSLDIFSQDATFLS